MRGQPAFFALFIFLFALFIDLYTFRGVSTLLNTSENRYRIYINFGFWLVTFVTLVWLIWFYFSFNKFSSPQMYKYATIFMGFFILFYVPKLFFITFQIVNDVVSLTARFVSIIFPKNSDISNHAVLISRSDFILKAGILIAALPFLSIICLRTSLTNPF